MSLIPVQPPPFFIYFVKVNIKFERRIFLPKGPCTTKVERSVIFPFQTEIEGCIVIKQHRQECVSLEVIPHGL